MVFKKGFIPWNKGKKGVMPTPWNKGIKGRQLWHNISGLKSHKSGEFKHSRETKKKLSQLNTGRKPTIKQLKALKLGQKYFRGKTKENCDAIKRRSMKLSKLYQGKKNPGHSIRMKEYYLEHPDKHPNRLISKDRNKKGHVSIPQRKIFDVLKNRFHSAELEYPIRTCNGIRFADIGIPSLKIDIEYDEPYWHQFKNDIKRDKEIKSAGWVVVRLGVDDIDIGRINTAINKAIIKAMFDMDAYSKKLCPVDSN